MYIFSKVDMPSSCYMGIYSLHNYFEEISFYLGKLNAKPQAEYLHYLYLLEDVLHTQHNQVNNTMQQIVSKHNTN